jgi:hypothetical protein
LELSTILSEESGGEIEVTLVDKGEAFVFGFSKLDLMFGREQPDAVRMSYGDLAKPGVRVLRETVTAIDPEARRVTTDAGTYEGDALVIALGADYDFEATPGLLEAGNEFYSVAGAERLAEIIPSFSEGHAVIGVAGAPFKCPPAPSECALLLDEELRSRGVRDACRISFVIPLPTPVPPSPEASAALEAEFAERGIELITGRRVSALDPERSVALLDDGGELPFDLFLGVPQHRAPEVDRQRHDRGRLRAGRPGHPGDALPRGIRGRRRCYGGRAQGRCVCRGRRARGRTGADREVRRWRGAGAPPRSGHLLHRVWRRPGRQRRHRFPLRPFPDRPLQCAVERAGDEEGTVRLEPPGALVRFLSRSSGCR